MAPHTALSHAGQWVRSPNDRFVLRRPRGLSVESDEDVLSTSSTPTHTSSEGRLWEKQARGGGGDVLRGRAGGEQFKVAPPSDLCALQQGRPIPVLEGATNPHSPVLFLAHEKCVVAWTTSKGTAMRERDHPGWLRAHKIVSKKRFARMQPWSTPRSMSGCTLVKGGEFDS